MRHSGWIRALGIILVAAVSLSIGNHSPIQAGQPTSMIVSSAVVAGAFGGGDADPDPRVIHLSARPVTKEAAKIAMKLQEKVPMEYPIGASLEDVVKHIRQNTVDKVEFPEGIPIYIDPIGLQEADKTAASMVTIDLKGIPLTTTLKLLLDQLSLAYWIHPDGLLIITSKDNESIPVDADGVIIEQLTALRQELKALREEVRFSRGMSSGPIPGPADSKLQGGMGAKGGMM